MTSGARKRLGPHHQALLMLLSLQPIEEVSGSLSGGSHITYCVSQEDINNRGITVNDRFRGGETGPRSGGCCDGLGASRPEYKLGRVEPQGQKG